LFYTTISKTGKDIFTHFSCVQLVSNCGKEIICPAVCDTKNDDVLHINDISPCENCIKSHLKSCDILSKNLARMRILESKIHRDSINDTKNGLSAKEKKIMRNICRDTFYELLPLEKDKKISMPLLKWLAKEEDPSIAITEIFQKYFSVCRSIDARHPAEIRSFEEERCINDIIEAPKISLICKDVASPECKKTFTLSMLSQHRLNLYHAILIVEKFCQFCN